MQGGYSMQRSLSISPLIAILIALTLQGCIHTYPEGNGDDPTEVKAALELDLGKEWTEQKIFYGEESRSAQSPLLRTTVSISGKDGKASRFEKIVSQDEIGNGVLLLPLPAPLHAQVYNINVWCDYVDPISQSPLGYDLTSLSDIKSLYNNGLFLSYHDCRHYNGTIDLSMHKGEWDVKKVIPIGMQFPTGAFRIVAEDYRDFLQLFSSDFINGEEFTVVVEYECDVPYAFNLRDDVPTRPKADVKFSRTLDYIIFPVEELEIAADRLFVTDKPMKISMCITLFNSAKAIVARTESVTFPIERGKTTTVSGKFLTNFISGGLTIDTRWDGEITIDIE